MRFRFREARPFRFRWIGPSDSALPLRLPVIGPVAAVIGPTGQSGPPGPPGTPGDGATDPGDLTLVFNNHLL
jgi:hypothetical protein